MFGSNYPGMPFSEGINGALFPIEEGDSNLARKYFI
jgi:hypothetical protein